MIVVTGGAGFIGSCLVRELNNRSITDILIVDDLGKNDKWKNLLGKKFTDIVNKTTFRENLLYGGAYGAKIEAIFHIGACSTTTEGDADYLLSNNYEYSKDLALYAINRNIRFIYASSAATYGDGTQGYSDYEFDSLRPLNMYGYSKHLFDQWIIQQGYLHKVIGIKFFNVFGPNEYHKGDMASLIYKAYHQIQATGKIRLFKSYHEVYGDGESMRDFIYVKDVVSILCDFLKYGEISGIFNLGTGKARSWNDLAKAVFSAIEKPLSIDYIEMPEALRGQYQYFTEADMTKLRTVRAYHEARSLEDSVRDYIREYLIKADEIY